MIHMSYPKNFQGNNFSNNRKRNHNINNNDESNDYQTNSIKYITNKETNFNTNESLQAIEEKSKKKKEGKYKKNK